MLGLQYAGMVLRHWKQWRPKAYKEMQKDGTLQEFAQSLSKQAATQVASLMAAGLQKHEAEEMVMPDILWPPED
ncbi:hypothetical protein [Cupriavidus oxalaticus]|uniref:hypothetical protein n=1 Tax=Cupriavidus oxalaticus TaxID=96344 RepID=UPI00403319BA